MGCIHSDFLEKIPSKTNLFHRKRNLDLVYDNFTDDKYYSLNTYYKYYNNRTVHI